MAQQVIGIGASANDGTGDSLRVGGEKINENFTELYEGKIDSIQAGTNVTVDNTDPLNPIVSASGGGGSGTVESVTGDGVDNTDPDNPVLSFPTPGDIGAEVSGTAAGLVATEVTNRNAAIASAVAGLMDYRGVFDASVNAYPSSGGSGTAGAILKSDFWIVSVAGTLPTGLVVAPGDLVISKIDTPGNTQANWSLVEYNIGFTPVNKAGDTMGGNLAMGGNKVTGLAAASGNGDAVRYEQLPAAASETVSGLMEIATQTETDLGTDDLRAVTPLKGINRYAVGGDLYLYTVSF
jgi:hypothetical protein